MEKERNCHMRKSRSRRKVPFGRSGANTRLDFSSDRLGHLRRDHPQAKYRAVAVNDELEPQRSRCRRLHLVEVAIANLVDVWGEVSLDIVRGQGFGGDVAAGCPLLRGCDRIPKDQPADNDEHPHTGECRNDRTKIQQHSECY